MKFRDEALWDFAVEESPDPWGVQVFTFAREWAEKMEERIANGETVEGCADATFSECSTPFDHSVYQAVVSILTRTWIHGEEFSKWRV